MSSHAKSLAVYVTYTVTCTASTKCWQITSQRLSIKLVFIVETITCLVLVYRGVAAILKVCVWGGGGAGRDGTGRGGGVQLAGEVTLKGK